MVRKEKSISSSENNAEKELRNKINTQLQRNSTASIKQKLLSSSKLSLLPAYFLVVEPIKRLW